MKRLNFEKIKKSKLSKLNFKKSRVKKVKEPKEKNSKIKRKKNKLLNLILIVITILGICAILVTVGFGYYIVKSAPEFDPTKLYEKEATLIYDAENKLIATLGTEKREKVTYDELPEILVDAIVATEDSRFFQHNGFDLPRFLKASLGQLMGNSSAGGGSTLTMQVSKNTFTSVEAEGIAGIIRKFTDIYMAIFKIEKYYTKEEILEFYVNAPYLGSGAYGVEQASQTFFGKSVNNLSLPEAALIAGLFQAPGAYDPYINPEAAEARRNQVLNLMVRHGYISEKEANAAKEISVESLLRDDYTTVVSEYQGFIDTVVQEVIDNTGSNPYDVPMEIYSTMVTEKQDVINDLYNGSLGYKFKDNVVQLGVAVIDNDSGALIAIGAGRNKTKEMTFNYATMTDAHPGSTAKPIFDYGPGIEYLKWSTYTPFFDDKETKYSSGKRMNNWDGKFMGMLSLSDCLSKSRNTCALQAFQQIDNAKIYDFVTSLGIKPETTGLDDTFINEAHSVGGFTGVSPVQLAGAYTAFANGGYYTKPYSYTKIVLRETDEEYEADVTKKRVMSPQTAYLITNILFDVTPSTVKVSGTQIATKTGTSSYDSDLLESLGLTTSVIRDSWIATYSPDYTMTMWYGYDKIDQEMVKNKYYNLMSATTVQRNKIQGYLVNNIMEKNSKFKSPGGVVSSKVEFGTIPAQLPSDYTPSSLVKSYLFISGTEPTEISTRYSKLTNPSNVTVAEDLNIVNISWTSPGIPSAIDTAYLTDYFNNNYGAFATKYYNERITYNNKNIGSFGFDIYLVHGNSKTYVGWTQNTNYNVDLTKYSGTYDSILVKSAYSIFKSNASEGVKKNLESYEGAPVINISFNPKNLLKDAAWPGISESEIASISITVNGVNVTEYDITDINFHSAIKDGEEITSVNDITKAVGVYQVKYIVSIDINGTIYTKTITQTVNVT